MEKPTISFLVIPSFLSTGSSQVFAADVRLVVSSNDGARVERGGEAEGSLGIQTYQVQSFHRVYDTRCWKSEFSDNSVWRSSG